MSTKITWPAGKQFAFSVFDDTDWQTLDNVSAVYALLDDLGFRTTKSCWPVRGDEKTEGRPGQTCDDAEYRDWVVGLQRRGFEIGWHNSTWHGLPREQISGALDRFTDVFGSHPKTAANHSVGEAIYWGPERVTGPSRCVYNVLTCFRQRRRFFGQDQRSEFFWGDLCKERIKYLRNFVFPDINTLKACPFMPYHDRLRPYVNYWFASSEGANVHSYNACLSEENQDQLEREGGACIMYTHFANGFYRDGQVDSTFTQHMTRLAKKNGWFVPVGILLDHILEQRGPHEITRHQRICLEWKWLFHKLHVGTT